MVKAYLRRAGGSLGLGVAGLIALGCLGDSIPASATTSFTATRWTGTRSTILLLLLRTLVPAVGEPIWRAYGPFLAWLIVTPVRLIRLLAREAFGRRH